MSRTPSETDDDPMGSPSETGGCPRGMLTPKGCGLKVFDLKGYTSNDSVNFPKKRDRKDAFAEYSVGLYHFAAGVMTEEDLKTLRHELIEYNLFIPKDLREDLSQFRIIKRQDTASRVDLFLVDCLFPGNPEIQEFRQDVGSRLEDEPYPAVRVPERVTLIKGNDMTNIVIENGRYTIPVTRPSSQDNTHAEETRPEIVRDTPQSNQPEQNQQSLPEPPQTEPRSAALPRQQPPSTESLRAGLRWGQSIGPLPPTLPQQLPAFEESLHTKMQPEPPLAEPSSRALPTTEPLDHLSWSETSPLRRLFTGQAPMNRHFSDHLLPNDSIYGSVSNPASLDGFSGFTNAMRARGPLDPEQISHRLSMVYEQQRNDEQTSRARGVDYVQNPTYKRARVRDRNIGLVDPEQRSHQVQTAQGQQKNNKHSNPDRIMSPTRMAISNIRSIATQLDELLETQGDSLGGMEDKYATVETIRTSLFKLHGDVWMQLYGPSKK